MRQHCQGVHYNYTVACLNEEKENIGMGFNETATNLAIRRTMTTNSSSSNQQQPPQYSDTQCSSSGNSTLVMHVNTYQYQIPGMV